MSVVVAARNEGSLIHLCLNALAKQEVSVSYEVVVVDNASTDDTAEIARATNCVVMHEPKPCQLRAKHRGVVTTRGEIVCVLDADCVPDRDWLEAIWRRFNAPDAGALVGVTSYYRFGSEMPLWGRWYVRLVRDVLVVWYRRGFRTMPFVVGGNVAFRRDAYFRAGGYPQDGGIAQTEIGLAKRLGRIGVVAYLPGMSVQSSARRFHKGWLNFVLRYKLGQYFLPVALYRFRKFIRGLSRGERTGIQ